MLDLASRVAQTDDRLIIELFSEIISCRAQQIPLSVVVVSGVDDHDGADERDGDEA